MSTAEQANAGQKYCYACKLRKPVDEFSANSTRSDGKQSICKACALEKKAEDRDSERQRKFKEGLAALLANLNSEEPNVPSLCTITAGLVEMHGGVEGFLTQVFMDASDARRLAPGSKRVLDFDMGMIKFLGIAHNQRGTIRDLASMNEADLNRLVADVLTGRLAAQSELALEEIAAERGMRLVRAEEAPHAAAG